MASQPLSVVRGVRSHAIDAPLAALAGLSVAFAAFAMPSGLFADLVAGTGISSLLAAAEPPFGLKARLAAGGGAAIAVFALVFLLLRGADRIGPLLARFRREEEPVEMPRTRRRDFHPDAPSPRPILAGRDLGDPEPAVPIWLDDAEASNAAEAPEPETEPESEPFEFGAAPAEEELVLSEPEPEPAPEPEGEAEAEPAAPEPAREEESIADLVARLERGMAGRRRAAPAPAGNAGAAMPQVFPEAADDRLKSAIESLQRLAARQA